MKSPSKQQVLGDWSLSRWLWHIASAVVVFSLGSAYIVYLMPAQ